MDEVIQISFDNANEILRISSCGYFDDSDREEALKVIVELAKEIVDSLDSY
jgi:hypothetical protein